MDYVTLTSVLVLLQCLTVNSFPSSETRDCRKCKPGYFAVSQCSFTSDTLCRRCPHGYFTSEWNSLPRCTPCSHCGQGLYALKQCTRTSDVFCESCTSASSNTRHLECAGLDQDTIGYLGDQPEPVEDEDGNKVFEKLDTSYLERGENDDEGEEDNEDEDVSSGELVVIEQTTEDKVTNLSPDTDISDFDLSEGSGYVLSEENEDNDEIAELLANAATVEPEVAREDELLPVGKSATTELPYDVVTLDLDEEGSGLVIEEASNVNLTETVTESPDLTEETSKILVDINFSGDGEEKPSSGQDIIIFSGNKGTTEEAIDDNDTGDDANKLEEISVEASTDEEIVVEGGMDGKTRTAVIVGVAAGAVIFFALGFFASRQCKKRHSFKSMKKVDSPSPKANGSPEEVHFRGGRSSGKYDPGAYERSPPVSPVNESVVLLSTKPLGAENNALANQDPYLNGIDRIKYMDETTDEEPDLPTPRDRLIKSEATSKAGEDGKGGNSLENEVLNKLDDKLAPIEEELQPMLQKENAIDSETS